MRVKVIFDFVYSLPKNINSNCGELGDKLSGGQKQSSQEFQELFIEIRMFLFLMSLQILDKRNEEEILEDVKNMSGKTKF